MKGLGWTISALHDETQEEFRTQMQLAVEAYERAAELFKRVEEAKRSSAKILHCGAMVAYILFFNDGKRVIILS